MAPRPVPWLPAVEYPSPQQRADIVHARAPVDGNHLHPGHRSAVCQIAQHDVAAPLCLIRLVAASVHNSATSPASRSRNPARRPPWRNPARLRRTGLFMHRYEMSGRIVLTVSIA